MAALVIALLSLSLAAPPVAAGSRNPDPEPVPATEVPPDPESAESDTEPSSTPAPVPLPSDATFAPGEDSRDGDIDLTAVPDAPVARSFSMSSTSTATATGLPAHPDVTFGAGQQVGRGWPATGVIFPGDWDRNGFHDLMLRRADGTLWLYPVTGSGPRFGTPRQIGHGWGTFDVVLGGVDWNRDGNPDLIARRSDGRLFAYHGNGRGGFSSSTQIGRGWSGMRTISVVQHSVGGRPGLIATSTEGQMTIYPTTTSGGFAAPIPLGRGWASMQHIVGTGDWDGNGASDLLAVDSNGYLRLYAASSAATTFRGYQLGRGWGHTTAIGTTAQTSVGTELFAVAASGRLWNYKVTTRSTPDPSVEPGTTMPWSGEGYSVIAPGQANGSGLGSTLTYRVEVEAGLPVNTGAFAAEVHTILNDPRGWRRNFNRTDGTASVRLILASPALVDRLCAPLATNGYTSCRVGSNVVINAHRWAYNAQPFVDAGGSLDEYRRYVINHEMGHALGHGHVTCPGTGQLAPVMQQQTLRTLPCQPNGWPNP